ncbi:unnamed protein product [Rhodiola kirilowii]
MTDNGMETFDMATDSDLNPPDWDDLISDMENDEDECRCGHSDCQGQYAEFLKTLSPKVRKRVDALKEIQRQHEELEAKLLEEKAALDAIYQKLYQPLYTKRFEIVRGTVEASGIAYEAAKDQDGNKTEAERPERGMPEFWLRAMKTNYVLSTKITKRDKAALRYLQDVKWSRIDDPKGFKLEFFFSTNPFFKNPVLTKTYHMADEDKPVVEKAVGTAIDWYPGKCLTQNILKKKPKAVFNYMRPDWESFFNFFNSPQPQTKALEDFKSELEPDYKIGSAIRDMIPHALSWFTGEAVQEEDTDHSWYNEDDDSDDADSEARRKVPQFNIPSVTKPSVKITYPDGRPFVLLPRSVTQSASPVVQTFSQN